MSSPAVDCVLFFSILWILGALGKGSHVYQILKSRSDPVKYFFKML